MPGESHGQRSLAGCSPWGRTESAVSEAPYQAQTGGGETAPAGCLLLDGPRAQAQSLFGDEKLSSEGSEEPWKKAQAHLL